MLDPNRSQRNASNDPGRSPTSLFFSPSLACIGYRELGLTTVANVVPCTRQALYKRFGSKRGLMLEYAEWSLDRAQGRYREVIEGQASPLSGLRTQLLLPAAERPDELHDPQATARTLTFRLETADDPAFQRIWCRRDAINEAGLVATLVAAKSAGELTADADPPRLGCVLYLALVGFTVTGRPRAGESVRHAILDLLEATLRPYLTQSLVGAASLLDRAS